jgi:hypothetical protein
MASPGTPPSWTRAAGAELLGEITRAEMGDQPYAFRHFRAPDGRVYGLNQLG